LWVLNKRNVPRGYIESIKNMYEGAVTSVRTTYGKTREFPVNCSHLKRGLDACYL
jgi:hypothetical protein